RNLPHCCHSCGGRNPFSFPTAIHQASFSVISNNDFERARNWTPFSYLADVHPVPLATLTKVKQGGIYALPFLLMLLNTGFPIKTFGNDRPGFLGKNIILQAVRTAQQYIPGPSKFAHATRAGIRNSSVIVISQ